MKASALRFKVGHHLPQKPLEVYASRLAGLPPGRLQRHPSLLLGFQEQDVVLEFLNNNCNIEDGDPKDHVKVCDLFNDYNQEYRGLRQDKKTKKGVRDFEKALKRCLKTHEFKDKHQSKIDASGVNRTIGKVFLGCRRVVR